jgi:hypothetical protein
MNRPVPGLAGVCVAVLHARFLRLLPKIETHARIVFRGVRCPVRQEDRVQECVALGWKWFLRLSEQGKDVFAFPMAFASLLARAVKCETPSKPLQTLSDALRVPQARGRAWAGQEGTGYELARAGALGPTQAQDARVTCQSGATGPSGRAADPTYSRRVPCNLEH